MKRKLIENKSSILAKPKDNKHPAEPPPQPAKARGLKSKRNSDASVPGNDANKKLARLALIKSRHEAIKREIDQIREDLDSEEDD